MFEDVFCILTMHELTVMLTRIIAKLKLEKNVGPVLTCRTAVPMTFLSFVLKTPVTPALVKVHRLHTTHTSLACMGQTE